MDCSSSRSARGEGVGGAEGVILCVAPGDSDGSCCAELPMFEPCRSDASLRRQIRNIVYVISSPFLLVGSDGPGISETFLHFDNSLGRFQFRLQKVDPLTEGGVLLSEWIDLRTALPPEPLGDSEPGIGLRLVAAAIGSASRSGAFRGEARRLSGRTQCRRQLSPGCVACTWR
jgi:hypothetical protein